MIAASQIRSEADAHSNARVATNSKSSLQALVLNRPFNRVAGKQRIFIFKSEAKPDLRAFGGDLAGSQLPSQFKPWRAVGAVAPDQQPPYIRFGEARQVHIKVII